MSFINNAPDQLYSYLLKNRENVVTALLTRFDHFVFADIFRCLIDIPSRGMLSVCASPVAGQPWWVSSEWLLQLLSSQFNRERTCTQTSIVLCSIIQRAVIANDNGWNSGVPLIMSVIVSDSYLKYLLDRVKETESKTIADSIISVLDRLLWNKMPKGFVACCD